MSYPDQLPLAAFFEDGSSVSLPSAQRLSDIVPDLGSWIGFLSMLAGGPAAPMTARSADGRQSEKMRVIYGDQVKDEADSYAALNR